MSQLLASLNQGYRIGRSWTFLSLIRIFIILLWISCLSLGVSVGGYMYSKENAEIFELDSRSWLIGIVISGVSILLLLIFITILSFRPF